MALWLDAVVQDVRHGLRSFRADPWFTTLTIGTLGAAIGVTTVVFSLINGILLRSLPYPDPDRLVRISEYHPGGQATLVQPSLLNITFDAWKGNTRTLEDFGPYSERAYAVLGAGDADWVVGASLSPAIFRMLRATPRLGRFFTAEETMEGADRVVVLSSSFWQQRFGGRPDAIGQTLTIDGRRCVIIGVAPEDFSFPDSHRQLFTPFVMPRASAAPGAPPPVSPLSIMGRLRPDATPAHVENEGTAIARGLAQPPQANMFFGQGGPVTIRVRTMLQEMTAGARPALLVLSGAVILVLLIACANVACLLLSRGVDRERELSVRAALGAGRWQLLRQQLTESATLGLLAGLVGILLAWWLLRLLPSILPPSFPRVDGVRLDPRALLFACGVALASGVLAGIVPSLRARHNLVAALGARGASSGAGAAHARRGLLIAEAALSVILIVGAILLTRSFVRLLNVDTGYDAGRVLTARISGPGGLPRSGAFTLALLDRIRALPGVEAAGASNMAPFGDATHLLGFRLSGDRPEPIIASALGYVVTPGYIEALRLRLRQGRMLAPSDADAGTQAIVVNQAFVKAYLNDGRPAVGRQYKGLLAEDLVAEIVGVVSDVLKDGPLRAGRPELYVPYGRHGAVGGGRQIFLVIRTLDDPLRLTAPLRDLVAKADPTAVVHNIDALDDDVSHSVAQPRFTTVVLTGFAAIALGFAGVGLCSVLSYAVSRRRRELGVRAALGATRGDLIALVVREGVGTTLAGVIVGLAAAVILAGLLRTVLFGIGPLDVVSFLLAPAIILIVALVACALPARRAASVDPIETLKAE